MTDRAAAALIQSAGEFPSEMDPIERGGDRSESIRIRVNHRKKRGEKRIPFSISINSNSINFHQFEIFKSFQYFNVELIFIISRVRKWKRNEKRIGGGGIRTRDLSLVLSISFHQFSTLQIDI